MTEWHPLESYTLEGYGTLDEYLAQPANYSAKRRLELMRLKMQGVDVREFLDG